VAKQAKTKRSTMNVRVHNAERLHALRDAFRARYRIPISLTGALDLAIDLAHKICATATLSVVDWSRFLPKVNRHIGDVVDRRIRETVHAIEAAAMARGRPLPFRCEYLQHPDRNGLGKLVFLPLDDAEDDEVSSLLSRLAYSYVSPDELDRTEAIAFAMMEADEARGRGERLQ